MARRRYRRFYKRRSGRWSANIQEIVNNTVPVVANSTIFASETICSNPTQSPAFVSQTYTVKNVELSLEMESSNDVGMTYVESLALYIMYVPQGMQVTADYNIQHPEYIMAYRNFMDHHPLMLLLITQIGRNPT